MSIPNRAPSSIWCLSMSDLNTYVRTEADDQIFIVGPDSLGHFVGKAMSALPHQFPKAAMDVDWLLGWACVACKTWVSESHPEDSGECAVDWRAEMSRP